MDPGLLSRAGRRGLGRGGPAGIFADQVIPHKTAGPAGRVHGLLAGQLKVGTKMVAQIVRGDAGGTKQAPD